MKTLREYIDIVNEAGTNEWEQKLAQEVKKRGLPSSIEYNVGYTKDTPCTIIYDGNKELYAWFEDYGIGLWKIDKNDNFDGYSDLNSLISAIKSVTNLTDYPLGDFQYKIRDKGGDIGKVYDITAENQTGKPTSGYNILENLMTDSGAEYWINLIEKFDSGTASPRINEMELEENDSEFRDFSFGNDCTLEWPGFSMPIPK